MSNRTCKNCDHALPEQAEFCPHCGQSIRELRQPWLSAASEMLDELFNVDGRMLQSARWLVTKPGYLASEYVRGRRVSITSPVRMYVVVSLLFFFVLPLALPPRPELAASDHQFSVDLYSKAMFVLLPLFALLLKLFYRKRYYLEHLVFTAYLFSAMFIGFALMISFESLADRHVVFMILQTVIMIIMVVYGVIALRTMYEESRTASILKFFGLFFAFLPLLVGAIELASHSN